MSDYINIPKFTNINDIAKNNYSLSATQYKTLCIKNKNIKKLSELIERPLTRTDLGVEIGSNAYIDSSSYFFLKTKGLQKESYLIDENKESVQPMIPNNFVQMNLQKDDIIISKDSNVGEIIILDKDYPNYMLSSALYKLPIAKNKLYILAFIKSDLFREQIDFLVPRGATIRHGKTKFLDCYIPFPNTSEEEKNNNVIRYVELLMRAIINKEIEIKNKYNVIQNNIQDELKSNQLSNNFKYKYPSINEIISLNRMDSCLYTKDFKEKQYLIDNYSNGSKTVKELGFDFVRGNNLAVSVIGKSIYSDKYYNGFNTLILPKNITKYGTLNKLQYLGNKSKLLYLKQGAIIFGAEGNEKGRSYIMIEDKKNVITNFHGLSLYNKNNNLQKSIFIKLFLDYFRAQGLIDSFAVGGNGGSLSIKYWDNLKFPNFPDSVEKSITNLYHNSSAIYNSSSCTLDNFLAYDNQFNKDAGIYELDKSLKYLQDKLKKVIEDITNDVEINIEF